MMMQFLLSGSLSDEVARSMFFMAQSPVMALMSSDWMTISSEALVQAPEGAPPVPVVVAPPVPVVVPPVPVVALLLVVQVVPAGPRRKMPLDAFPGIFTLSWCVKAEAAHDGTDRPRANPGDAARTRAGSGARRAHHAHPVRHRRPGRAARRSGRSRAGGTSR